MGSQQDAVNRLQRRSSKRTRPPQKRSCEPPAPVPRPRVPGVAGRMRGVGNSIAMVTVTSFYPGSNWRKPRGRSRSLPANRTCPSRPTLLASPSPLPPRPLLLRPRFRALSLHWSEAGREAELSGTSRRAIGGGGRPRGAGPRGGPASRLRGRLRREGPRLKPEEGSKRWDSRRGRGDVKVSAGVAPGRGAGLGGRGNPSSGVWRGLRVRREAFPGVGSGGRQGERRVSTPALRDRLRREGAGQRPLPSWAPGGRGSGPSSSPPPHLTSASTSGRAARLGGRPPHPPDPLGRPAVWGAWAGGGKFNWAARAGMDKRGGRAAGRIV